MYRTGHLGVSLLVFAPVGHLLVSAGLPVAAFVVGATMCWLSMLPDVDHRLPFVPHRGPTHTLLFAVAVGVAFAGVGVAAGPAITEFVPPPFATVPTSGFSVGFVGFVAVAAHLLGDVLTPAGVPLLWPLSARRYSLSVARANNVVANYLLFALGAFAVVTVAVFVVR